MLSKSQMWRASIGIFVAALFYRLGWVVATDQIHQFPLKEMVRAGIDFARNGEIGNPFAIPTGPTATVTPVYPMFLGLIFRVFGTGVGAEIVKCVLTSAVSAVRCALMPFLALRVGLSFRTGLIAGGMSIFYIGALQTEIKGDWAEAYGAVVLVGWFLAAIQVSTDARLGLRRAAVFGLFCGLSLLLMPNFVVIVAGGLIVGGFQFLRKCPRQYLLWVGVMVLTAAVVISPWLARNSIRLGSPVWLKDNLGLMMLLSNAPGASWEIDGCNDLIDQRSPVRNANEARKLKRIGEVPFYQAMMKESLQGIRSNPRRFAELTALRSFHFWFPLMKRNAIHVAAEWALTLTAFVGLYFLYTKSRAAALLISSMWLLYPIVYYVVMWSSRYRYPINWTLILTASITVGAILESYDFGSRKRTNDAALTESGDGRELLSRSHHTVASRE